MERKSCKSDTRAGVPEDDSIDGSSLHCIFIDEILQCEKLNKTFHMVLFI